MPPHVFWYLPYSICGRYGTYYIGTYLGTVDTYYVGTYLPKDRTSTFCFLSVSNDIKLTHFVVLMQYKESSEEKKVNLLGKYCTVPVPR